jgi:hypothetical protein
MPCQGIFGPDFSFTRFKRSQHFFHDLLREILTLQTQGSFNDKLVMSKPAQLAKLIELRKNLRRENQNRWYRHDLLKDFLTRRPVVGLRSCVGGLSLGFLRCH